MKNFLIVFTVCFLIVMVTPKKYFRKFDRMLNDTETIRTSNDEGTKYTSDPETMKYFNEICLKSELNSRLRKSPKKYKKNVRLYISGDYEQFMLDEVNKVIMDLNDLIDPINFSVVKDESESNMTIYFGDYNSFISQNPDLRRINKLKNCEGFFMTKTGRSDEIKSSRIFINLPKQDSDNDIRDAIREEMTQALGFYNDSWLYPESCFYQGGNEAFEYSNIDVKLIKLLYNV